MPTNLRKAYEAELAEIRECNKAVINMTHENSKDCWLILAMVPLKIEIHPFTYEFCPVHMYLFENGHAVIKTSIPLEDIDAGPLATYPMQTWFGEVKVWEAAIKQGGRQEYKIVQEQGNEKIFHLLLICYRSMYTDCLRIICWMQNASAVLKHLLLLRQKKNKSGRFLGKDLLRRKKPCIILQIRKNLHLCSVWSDGMRFGRKHISIL